MTEEEQLAMSPGGQTQYCSAAPRDWTCTDLPLFDFHCLTLKKNWFPGCRRSQITIMFFSFLKQIFYVHGKGPGRRCVVSSRLRRLQQLELSAVKKLVPLPRPLPPLIAPRAFFRTASQTSERILVDPFRCFSQLIDSNVTALSRRRFHGGAPTAALSRRRAASF
ncbi:uncharacterized protein V6R79_012687 [Siganus canaliculatus]